MLGRRDPQSMARNDHGRLRRPRTSGLVELVGFENDAWNIPGPPHPPGPNAHAPRTASTIDGRERRAAVRCTRRPAQAEARNATPHPLPGPSTLIDISRQTATGTHFAGCVLLVTGHEYIRPSSAVPRYASEGRLRMRRQPPCCTPCRGRTPCTCQTSASRPAPSTQTRR